MSHNTVSCTRCHSVFKSHRALSIHYNRKHYHNEPLRPRSTFRTHPLLDGKYSYSDDFTCNIDDVYPAQPCDEDGDFLPFDSPPLDLADDDTTSYSPFANREAFELAELLFCKEEMSKGNTDTLLDLWARQNASLGLGDGANIFTNTKELFATIDSIKHSNAPWRSVCLQYSGPLDNDAPMWKRAKYELVVRDTHTVVTNMLQNPGFRGHFDYAPFQEFVSPDNARYSNGMSGQWAYNTAVSIFPSLCSYLSNIDAQTEIAQDPNTHHAMLVPVLLGSDKTTTSVATGHTEFHPVYLGILNTHNTVRRAHQDAILPVAFLPIPKSMSLIYYALSPVLTLY